MLDKWLVKTFSQVFAFSLVIGMTWKKNLPNNGFYGEADYADFISVEG